MLASRNSSKIFLFTIVSISILAIASCFFGINRSLWLDEAYSFYTANQDFQSIISTLKFDSHPPLYFFILAIWMRVFGTSEFALRSLSVTFYLLSLVAVYLLSRSLYNDKKTVLLCMFVYMLSPLAIWQGQTVRMYSLLALLVAISTLFFFRLFLLKTNSKSDLTLYIISNILGTFTHYWFFFIVLSQIVSYILLFHNRASVKKFSLAVFISLVPFLTLWLPILLGQMKGAPIGWIVKPNITILGVTLFYYGGLALLASAACLVLAAFKAKKSKIEFQNVSSLKQFISRKENLTFLIFLSISLLVPLIISQVKPIYLLRYTVVGILPFAMLVGAFLSKFGNKLLVLAYCYISLITTSLYFVHRSITPQQDSDRLTTELLVKNAKDNDIIIFVNLGRLGIDYYLHRMKPNNNFVQISFPSEVASHPGWVDAGKMLKHRHLLEDESDKLISYIKYLTKNKNKNIWLFYSADGEISEIIKTRLDTELFLKKEHKSNNPFYTKLLVYQNKVPGK